jgi:peptide/nickel transport system ATP-binding protein
VRLQVRNLTVRYGGGPGGVFALRDVQISLRAGETLGIVGESGSGKTTILRSVLRLLRPPGEIVGGEVWFDGQDLMQLQEKRLRRIRGRRITAIFQNPANSFNPAETMGTQLERIFRLHRPGLGKRELRQRVIESLARVGVDGKHKLRNYPFEFSQGQLQRIMIAAACLAGEPSVVLADEPTTSLDVTIEAQVIRVLRQLTEELGISLVLVTHNLALVAELCDRVAVLYAGRVAEEASVRTLYRQPRHPYTIALLNAIPSMADGRGRLTAMRGQPPDLHSLPPGCAFAPRCAYHLGIVCDESLPALWQTATEGQLARCHVYDPSESHVFPLATPDLPLMANTAVNSDRPGIRASTILSVRDLRKHFVSEPFPGASLLGRRQVVRAVDGVTLELYRGETLGLIGESGCGKTTLGYTIMGILTPTSGEIEVDGMLVHPPVDRRERPVMREVQMVFQNPHGAVNRRKTVGQIVAEPLVVNGLRDESARRVRELLDLVALPRTLITRYPHELSGGELQRVVIARALVLRPRVLIGDEPTSSLDLSARAQIINLFDDLRRELGLTLLLISHDLATVAHLADRIAVMYLGRIVEVAPARQLVTSPQHPYSRALLGSIPQPDPSRRRGSADIVPLGEVPSALNRPSGCHYHPRCPIAMPICLTNYPELLPGIEGTSVACHAVQDGLARIEFADAVEKLGTHQV